MAEPAPLHFVFYFAAPAEKVWEGFVSPELNRIIFMGAELEVELRPGGSMNWVGPGPDGKRTTYVHGEVLQAEPLRLLQYTFALGASGKTSRVTVELVPETEATKVSVRTISGQRATTPTHPPRMAGLAFSRASRRCLKPARPSNRTDARQLSRYSQNESASSAPSSFVMRRAARSTSSMSLCR